MYNDALWWQPRCETSSLVPSCVLATDVERRPVRSCTASTAVMLQPDTGYIAPAEATIRRGLYICNISTKAQTLSI